jgi:hypothetical protein
MVKSRAYLFNDEQIEALTSNKCVEDYEFSVSNNNETYFPGSGDYLPAPDPYSIIVEIASV